MKFMSANENVEAAIYVIADGDVQLILLRISKEMTVAIDIYVYMSTYTLTYTCLHIYTYTYICMYIFTRNIYVT